MLGAGRRDGPARRLAGQGPAITAASHSPPPPPPLPPLLLPDIIMGPGASLPPPSTHSSHSILERNTNLHFFIYFYVFLTSAKSQETLQFSSKNCVKHSEKLYEVSGGEKEKIKIIFT